MTRTVFDNAMCAHEWAHGNGEARSNNGNMFARGDVLYSYGEHFPLAIRLSGGARPLFLLNADSYSLTTTRHQYDARRAVQGLGDVVTLHGLTDIARALFYRTRGRVREAALAALTRPDNADLSLDDVGAVLRAIGSRAKPENVKARAIKARDSLKALREKAKRVRTLQLARNALALSLGAFDGSSPNTALREMNYHLTDRLATDLNRAWRHAKAAGWSKKRLAELRKREKALRASGERLRARDLMTSRHSTIRGRVQTLRELCGGRPIREAFLRASSSLRVRIYDALISFTRSCRIAAFGVPRAAWDELVKALSLDATEARKAVLEARQAALRQREAETLAAWRRGEPVDIRYMRFRAPKIMLRAVNVKRNEAGEIIGGELQTSAGARVPLVQAVKVFRFLKLIRSRLLPDNDIAWRRNGERARVGSFELDHVYGSGTFKAGCHVIQWSEARDLAESLDVFDVSESDEVING